ncbi:MAG: sigma 54-interacting transcriptional regulator [Deltaproteobacteria bacterium]|nr:sigma 54-interacting transcriptional regulator [Deltaproteobacteria bacterium]
MKRILVVDESPAVRETLAIILQRDFTVVQRLPLADDSLADTEADLLILGVPPAVEREPFIISKVAAQVSYPVLVLVNSRSAANLWKGLGRADCLVKPFNPYELKEKVERLLAQSSIPPEAPTLTSPAKSRLGHYLEFPYLPEATSALAERYALTPFPILIIGEAGCGQERVARAIRSLNDKAGPWISAYPPEITRDCLLGQIDQLAAGADGMGQRFTLFLGNLETLHALAQLSLLRFLEDEEEKGSQFWILSSSQEDLLEKVYRGEFLSPLYYRLATLTLRLPPLRERQAELPSLAAALAQGYGERLNLGKVSFTPEAMERLCNYLWFGNLNELEAVIARTLAIHRKGIIEASELVLGMEEGAVAVPAAAPQKPVTEERPVVEEKPEKQHPGISLPAGNGHQAISRPKNGDSLDIRVLMNELAHELKNPMVTIKTFAQLLGDRFDDAAFRVRFQETVGGDIERMDDVLEAMLDFSRFTHPVAERISLYEQLRRVLEEIVPECLKRGATIRWGKKAEGGEVFVDEAQFRYAFKNVLQSVLAQVKPQGEIQIDVEGEGRVAVSYLPEGGRMSALTQYLDSPSSDVEDQGFPLRILLAKILVERNGGGIKINQLDGGKVLIRAELPAA